MNLRIVFLVIAVFGTLASGYGSAIADEAPPTPLSRAQAIEEIDTLAKALEDYHPGLHLYQNQEAWQTQVSSFKQNIPETISFHDFYLEANLLIRTIGDGHTRVIAPQNRAAAYAGKNVLPFNPMITGDRIFFDDTYANHPDLHGLEVLAVNGEATALLLNRLQAFVDIDGFGGHRKKRWLELSFGRLYAYFTESRTSDFEIVVADPQGEEKTMTLPGVPFGAWGKWRLDTHQAHSRSKLEFFAGGRVAYLDVGSFEDQEGVNFLQFIRNAFAEIAKRKPDSLIVDVRDNIGGIDSHGSTLAQYVLRKPFRYFDKIEVTDTFDVPSGRATPAEPGKVRQITNHDSFGILEPIDGGFDGKLFVLINSATFSTAADFAQTIAYNSDAILIGEETRGGYFGNTSWSTKVVTLPNSEIQVHIPLGLYYKSGGGKPDGGGVKPDVFAAPGPEDLLSGADSVLDKALELASK